MNLLQAAITATLLMYGAGMAIALLRLFRRPRGQDRVPALDFLFLVGLAALLVLSGAAVTFVPNARIVLGLVSARAFTRPTTLLTCAFAGDLLPVRA